jgi:hypothetical protein
MRPVSAGGNPYFTLEMSRGFPAVGSYQNWGAGIEFATYDDSLIPAFVPFDICVAWKGGAIVALGIGHDVGSTITWITPGTSFLGSLPVTMSSDTIDTAWSLADADSHIGLGADRDKTRFNGGWLQAIAASQTVPNAATIKNEIAFHIVERWGARQDYR